MMSIVRLNNDLWKSVENLGQYSTGHSGHGSGPQASRRGDPRGSALALRACSACSGDYEDPQRTAWPADSEDEEPDASQCNHGDEGEETPKGRDAGPSGAASDDDFPAQ